MDLHIFLTGAWNFLKWLIEKAVIPFAAAFGGGAVCLQVFKEDKKRRNY